MSENSEAGITFCHAMPALHIKFQSTNFEIEVLTQSVR